MELVMYAGIALALGVWIGGSVARFKRARSDVRGTRSLLGTLRKRRTTAGMHTAKATLALIVLVFIFIVGLRAAGRV